MPYERSRICFAVLFAAEQFTEMYVTHAIGKAKLIYPVLRNTIRQHQLASTAKWNGTAEFAAAKFVCLDYPINPSLHIGSKSEITNVCDILWCSLNECSTTLWKLCDFHNIHSIRHSYEMCTHTLGRSSEYNLLMWLRLLCKQIYVNKSRSL